MAALGHGRRSNLASEGSYPSDPLEITHGHRRGKNPLRPVSEDQRSGNVCDGRSTGLRAEAAAGRGAGVEILSRISCSAACSLAISIASLSTLCRIKSRLAGATGIVFSSHPIAIGLPSQSGNDTNKKRDQVGGEGKRG